MSIFSDAIDFLASIMQHFLSFCYQLTQMAGFPSYGIAIIVMTILIRVLLLPLAIKQIRSMKSMQEMQPRLQEIQKKYKGDPQRIQMEMTKMYQEMGVNPLSGCLPMLIQMPFLISIFYALRSYQYDPEHISFLWLPSLGATDPYYVLTVLSALSTFNGGAAAKNHAGLYAAFHRLHQLKFSERSGYLLGSFQFIPDGATVYHVS